ncbi:MAG: RES domain-containing protein [Lapillicoccus sp.]
MIAFRHCDRRWPFLWESSAQPPARWHGEGEGPVQYLADTPDGAWAEFIRHEEITDEEDLAGVSRALWAVSVVEPSGVTPDLPEETMTGGLDSYPDCQAEAHRLRGAGVQELEVPSAALRPGTAGGHVVDRGLQQAAAADGRVFVLFGRRPDVVGWLAVDEGRPPGSLVERVRPL